MDFFLQGLGGNKFSELTPHQRAALYWPGIQGNQTVVDRIISHISDKKIDIEMNIDIENRFG